MCVCIFEIHWHDVMYMSITMQYLCDDILHCPLSLEIMVCEELRVWHLTLFISKCDFLKHEDKTTRKETWLLGGHLGNKSLMKPIVRSFKMAMMLPLKLVQIVNANEWHGGVHLKSYFGQPKWQEFRKTTTRNGSATWQRKQRIKNSPRTCCWSFQECKELWDGNTTNCSWKQL